jgi:hypothetical protein
MDPVALAMLWLVVYGLPLVIAASPSLLALGGQRRVLGVMLLAGAGAAVIGLPLWQHFATQAALERGEIRDDIAFLFLPAVYGVMYALLAGLMLAVFVLSDRFFKREKRA